MLYPLHAKLIRLSHNEFMLMLIPDVLSHLILADAALLYKLDCTTLHAYNNKIAIQTLK